MSSRIIIILLVSLISLSSSITVEKDKKIYFYFGSRFDDVLSICKLIYTFLIESAFSNADFGINPRNVISKSS